MTKKFPPEEDQPRTKKIVFFGTANFGATVLKKLIESGLKPLLVVTPPDKPVGRKQTMTPPSVKIVAEQNNVHVIQPKKLNRDAKYKIQEANLDLLIVAEYGQIIPKKILGIPKYGALNVHPSLLPRWRGPSPIQYTILNGDKETGVTIMLMDEELDHGPILNSKSKIIANKLTTEKLSKELAEMGANLLIGTIPKWVAGKINPEEQNHKKAIYTKIIKKEDGHLDWSRPAEEIERKIRAFTPWPGSFTFWKNMRIEIKSGRISKNAASQNDAAGYVTLSNNELAVNTGEGIFIIDTLQPSGKKEMSSKEFLNGRPEFVGSILD